MNLIILMMNCPLDVDIDIPITRQVQEHTYALIIGNEDYKSRQKSLSFEQNAKYAIHDAEIFMDYCQKTLGVPFKAY